MYTKTFCYSHITAALAFIALAVGCASEEISLESVATTKSVQVGAPTYATINIELNEPVTKSGPVSDEAESDSIYSIRILMYGEKPEGEWICESDILAMNAGNRTATIESFSGKKRILVIANDYNRPWRFDNQTGRTIDELVSMKTVGGYRLASNEIDFGSPSLGGENASPMSDLDYASITAPFVFSNSLADSSSLREFKPGVPFDISIVGKNGASDNHFKIYLKRSLSKVAASYKGSTYPVPTEDGSGFLTDLYWGIRNQNRAVALFEVPGPEGKPVSPFFNELTGWNLSDLDDISSYQPFWWNGEDEAGDISIPLSSSIAPKKYYYVPENANQVPTPGNITCITVKATFTPAPGTVITSFTHDNLFRKVADVTRGDIEQGATFYRLAAKDGTDAAAMLALRGDTLIGNMSIFKNKSDALRMAYIAENKGYDVGFGSIYTPKSFIVETFQSGICYYRMDIRNGSRAWVERNKAYHGSIISFHGIGNATIAHSNLNLANNEAVYLGGTIEVIPWEEIRFEDTL
ncbi:MAG: hypothetical protein LBC81_03330 [Tannerellaceae bacterium]|jgi:hypothetical protein|nr:hypothetical protein [Tannerellaceae bacterium]